MSMSYADILAYQALTQRASASAQAAYNQSMASGAGEDRALAQAKFEWQKKMDEAAQTGKWNGIWNNPQQQWFTGQFGQWLGEGGEPTPGTQTQAVQQANRQYGLDQANVTGVYYDPGNMTYAPGTFVRDQETGGIGQIQSNGRLQMFGDQGDFLRAGGNWAMVNNPDMVRNVSSAEYNALANDPGANFGGRGNGTASLQLQALYGQYGLPTQGQQTLANIAQQNQIAQDWANIYGYTPQFDANGQPIGLSGGGTGGVPGQGSPQTLAAQGQYWEQAYKQAQANQANTQAYLGILANLRGPADWAKYQQVLGSTPQGMRDLYAASMGQYVPGGGATTGVQPQAASLQSLMGDVGGYGRGDYGQLQSYPYTTQPGAPQTPGQVAPGNMQWYGQQGWGTGETTGASGDFNTQGQWVADRSGQRPSQAVTGTMGWGENWGGPAGRVAGAESGQVWGSGLGVGGQGATPGQQIQATGNGTNMYGANQPQYNLPAPNQIAAQSWNNFTPSQRQMMLGMYEAQGYDKGDVEALYSQALPKYGQNAPSAGTWSMR